MSLNAVLSALIGIMSLFPGLAALNLGYDIAGLRPSRNPEKSGEMAG